MHVDVPLQVELGREALATAEVIKISSRHFQQEDGHCEYFVKSRCCSSTADAPVTVVDGLGAAGVPLLADAGLRLPDDHRGPRHRRRRCGAHH